MIPLASLDNLDAKELNTLKDIYDSTNGLYWQWRNVSLAGNVWNFSASNYNPCYGNWQGIECTCTRNNSSHYNHYYLYYYYDDFPDTSKCYVSKIFLSTMNLSGTLPDTIGSLTSLTHLHLNNNTQLSGTIPSSIGKLVSLEQLQLSSCSFYGSIPAKIGELSNLLFLSFRTNDLSGAIPDEIGQLHNLEYLLLSDNQLVESIPSSIGNLVNLHSLYLDSNYLINEIPVLIGALYNLQVLVLADNYLTGTIPAALGNLSSLYVLVLASNNLVGSIPSALGSLHNLESLYLYGNYLTSSIPPSICNLSELLMLVLHNNSISGSIPACFGSNITQLYALDLDNNHFTGTIPASICMLHNLEGMLLSANYLEGTIPECIGNLKHISYLYMANNRLEGSIPVTISSLEDLINVRLNNNFLSGAIPDVSKWRNLETFLLSNNSLSGSIPPSLLQLERLQYLFLSNNHISGNLDFIDNDFLVTASPLSVLDISFNQIDGTLPASVFLMPNLTTFAAGSNCLYGSIADSICGNELLEVISLDGLSSASTCRQNLYISLPGYQTYTIPEPRQLAGGLPECIFSMPNLRTFHAPGNGLQGKLLNVELLTVALTDLILSNNLMSGTIPTGFQDHQWARLDLSFNKFSGKLANAYPKNSTSIDTAVYALQVNRLSGVISTSYLGVLSSSLSISVLNGNTFSCGLSYDSKAAMLPTSDPAYKSYTCGSNDLYISLILWIAFAGTLICLLLLSLRRYRSEMTSYLGVCTCTTSTFGEISSTSSSDDKDFIQSMFASLKSLRAAVCIITCIIFAIFLPSYASLGHYYHNHADTYAFYASMAYLSGCVPGLLLLMLILLTMLGLICSAFKQVKLYVYSRSYDARSESIASDEDKTVIIIALLIIFMVNAVIISLVNAAYVLVAINYDGATTAVTQITLALVKSAWTTLGIGRLYQSVMLFVIRVSSGRSCRYSAKHIALLLTSSKNDNIQFFVFLALLNNFIIPCLVFACISPSCFRNALVAPADVTTSYAYTSCSGLANNVCIDFEEIDISHVNSNPFFYRYQCCSDMMVTYVPVYVYVSIAFGILYPLLICLIKIFHYAVVTVEPVPAGFSYHKLLDVLLFRLLRRPAVTASTTNAAASTTATAIATKVEVSTQAVYVIHNDTSNDTTMQLPFEKHNLIVSLQALLLILSTFGVAYPPLAAIILISISLYTIFLQGAFGYYCIHRKPQLPNSYGATDSSRELYSLNEECRNFTLYLWQTSWMLPLLVLPFFAFFLYDIYGDTMGSSNAIWIPIFMVSLAILCFYSTTIHRCYILMVEKVGSTTNGDNDEHGSSSVSYSDDDNTNNILLVDMKV